MLNKPGCLFAPVYHYYAGIKWFLVPVFVSKDGNIVSALEAIGHKTEVVAQGENNGQLFAKKTDRISKIILVLSDIFSKEGLVYTVVLTCVVGVADIITFSVAGRLTSQVGPLHAIM